MGKGTLVKPGTKVKLEDHDPAYRGKYRKADPEVAEKLAEDLQTMREHQTRLYAEHKQALLIVLQALDCGGKDGTIKHVMSGLNPQACHVSSFKVPSYEESIHDFLWRIHERCPRQGHIMVFNRSHYEDVLVARVHNLVPEAVWKRRYEHINNFEAHLADSGTRVIKFFLHISKEEQRQRLQARIDDPQKHWKLSPSDARERKLWDDYTAAYEDALSKSSTKHAPWHIIPADRKWYRNMVVADVVANTLVDMNPQWPKPKVDLDSYVID